MKRVLLRGQPWIVRDQISLGVRTLFRLEDPESGETVETLCPPDEFEPLVEPATALDRRSLTPFGIWRSLHEALRLQSPGEGRYAAFHAGRISPEPYQFAPLARFLSGPRRSLLIADDVGLGKTIEAGICLVELIARGVGKRILLVVPPGLIPQWLDKMWEKFGFEFQPIENAVSLDRAQTALSEGLHPLFRAVTEHALEELTLAPARNGSASRIAARRHSLAKKTPFALFTYLERQTHPAGVVFGVAVDAKGQVLDRSVADALLAEEVGAPGEASWAQCEQAFAASFASAQAAAARSAQEVLRERAKSLRAEHEKTANVLREEAALYRVDRLAEIDTEEKVERAGSREQGELFRDTSNNWQARRAAVDTHYDRRLKDIEHFAQVPEPPEPQPLGVLLVFPPA